MKKIMLLLFCGSTLLGYSQSSRGLHSSNSASLPNRTASLQTSNLEKTLLCQDTLRYAQAKEQVLGTNNFYTFDIWQADVEGFSQTFLNTGSTIVRGIEFFGANNSTDGTANVTVTASVYNVNATYVPTTLVTSGTVTFSSTTAGYHYVNFAAPPTVTGNYAVVIQATSTNGVFTCYVNDAAPAQVYDETFAHVKSNYYTGSLGAWVTVPALGIGNYNFESLIAPMVSYTTNTSFTASPTTACLGTPITFTNTTTPTAFLTNRMYNYQIFRTFFGSAPSDSTYVYDFDNLSPYAWTPNTTYTYPSAGTYDVVLGTNGGFWSSCFDFATTPITINALPTVSAGSNVAICQGGSTSLTATGANTYLWNNSAGSTATVSVSPTTTTTYTVTGTAVSTCQNTATVTVTVNPQDNANFAYSSSTLCSGGGNEIPTVSTAGTFSATPAGLNFVSTSTGEINMGTSTDGTYSVSYTTSGACPNTVAQNVTITAAPDATFNYTQGAYCSADSDPSPVFTTGSAGAFSAVTGLSLNTSTGQIDLSASTPGTYVVTNAIAASGACPATSETFTVVVNQTPTADVTGGGQQCGTGTINVSIALTGTGPWNLTYSNGSAPTTVTGTTTNPYVIGATASGTYTVTNVTQGTCSSVGTGAATVVFNANPTVSMNPVPTVCEGSSAITLVGTPAGGTFTGSGITGNTFDPTGLSPLTYGVDYDYTDANGCSGQASQSIQVAAVPAVTLSDLADMCIYNSAVTLTGGLPAGGSYTGTGVSAGSFDPATAGLGTHTILYSFTNTDGCSNSASQDIVVDACLGIEENTGFDVTISPNPASESFVITANGIENCSYSVVTNDGKLVIATKNITNGVSETVNVQGFAKGIYFIRFNSATQTATKKIIVD